MLCERTKRLFIPTGATRLQYRPVLRHLRSLIGSPTSDDERRSILLQFVRTDSDLRRQPQSRVSHSRSISYFEFAVRRRATPSGSETQSRFALPHSPPSKGTARRPHTSAASFPHLLGCAAETSWQRQLGRQNGIKLSSRASQRTRRRATSGSRDQVRRLPHALSNSTAARSSR
jgi:hypothetical protein